MKKFTLALVLSGSVFLAKSQNLSSISAVLDKIEKNNYKSAKEYDAFNLEGKKFFVLKDEPDHAEKHVIEFLPNNQVQLIEIIEDKSSKETFSNIFSGDVIRDHNRISVRADKLEGKQISVPVVFNFMLSYFRGVYYLKNINTNEKWLETHYLEKK